MKTGGKGGEEGQNVICLVSFPSHTLLMKDIRVWEGKDPGTGLG